MSKLPFSTNNDEKKYLIAPFGREDYQKVKNHKAQGKKLDYSIFREIIWGKKGKETHSYGMMIDWVVEHQYQPRNCTKEEIGEEYEVFLKKIYQECVRDNTI